MRSFLLMPCQMGEMNNKQNKTFCFSLRIAFPPFKNYWMDIDFCQMIFPYLLRRLTCFRCMCKEFAFWVGCAFQWILMRSRWFTAFWNIVDTSSVHQFFLSGKKKEVLLWWNLFPPLADFWVFGFFFHVFWSSLIRSAPWGLLYLPEGLPVFSC